MIIEMGPHMLSRLNGSMPADRGPYVKAVISSTRWLQAGDSHGAKALQATLVVTWLYCVRLTDTTQECKWTLCT